MKPVAGDERWNQCLRKYQYSHEAGANHVAKRFNKHNKRKTESPMHSYRCEFCGYFHVGHMRKQDLHESN